MDLVTISVVSENHFTVISQRDFTSNFSQDSFAIFVRLNFSVATLNPKILDQSNSFGEDYLNQVLNFRVTSFEGILGIFTLIVLWKVEKKAEGSLRHHPWLYYPQLNQIECNRSTFTFEWLLSSCTAWRFGLFYSCVLSTLAFWIEARLVENLFCFKPFCFYFLVTCGIILLTSL